MPATWRSRISQVRWRNRNVIFRIPTPTFGAGLIEMIPDSAILANQQANSGAKAALGIWGRANFFLAGRTLSGQTNNNGNDGTIARFGWKAQNKSLLLFSGEAYNVEMGVTNDLLMTERDENGNCVYRAQPRQHHRPGRADADRRHQLDREVHVLHEVPGPADAIGDNAWWIGIDQYRKVVVQRCWMRAVPHGVVHDRELFGGRAAQ